MKRRPEDGGCNRRHERGGAHRGMNSQGPRDGVKESPLDQEARMRLVSIKSISRRRELMIYPPTGVSFFFAVLFGIFTYPVLGVQIDDKDVTFAIEVELLNDESLPASLIGVKIQEDIEHELWWDKGLRFINAEKSKEAVIVKTI